MLTISPYFSPPHPTPFQSKCLDYFPIGIEFYSFRRIHYGFNNNAFSKHPTKNMRKFFTSSLTFTIQVEGFTGIINHIFNLSSSALGVEKKIIKINNAFPLKGYIGPALGPGPWTQEPNVSQFNLVVNDFMNIRIMHLIFLSCTTVKVMDTF